LVSETLGAAFVNVTFDSETGAAVAAGGVAGFLV
jgi:hypothetical protein